MGGGIQDTGGGAPDSNLEGQERRLEELTSKLIRGSPVIVTGKIVTGKGKDGRKRLGTRMPSPGVEIQPVLWPGDPHLYSPEARGGHCSCFSPFSSPLCTPPPPTLGNSL